MRCLYFAVVALAIVARSGFPQELEPRLFRNAPVGLNALAVSFVHSDGNVLVDSSLPLEDVDGDLDLVALSYLRTFGILGRSAKLEAMVPYAWGDYAGFLDSEFRTRNVIGWGDPRFRFAVNLWGAPALDAKDFSSYRQGTVVGAAIQVSMPVGKYEPDRLFNLGANRWSFRPEIGFSRVWRKWFFELAGGGLFFTTNDDFFGGQTLQQDSFYAFKGHVIRSFRPGLWLSFNFGYGIGGEWTLDGVPRGNEQRNSRLGATLSLPLAPGNRLMVTYMSGLTTRIGADFDAIGLSYLYTW